MPRFLALTAVVLVIGPVLGFAGAALICPAIGCGPFLESSVIVLIYILACFVTYRLAYR